MVGKIGLDILTDLHVFSTPDDEKRFFFSIPSGCLHIWTRASLAPELVGRILFMLGIQEVKHPRSISVNMKTPVPKLRAFQMGPRIPN
jgi:hypothetical protein